MAKSRGFRPLFGSAIAAVFEFLASLKLAVIVILGLVVSLAAGTILESVYDTPTSQYFVYHSVWFHLVLIFLGINIFCSAMSRFPWSKKHLPFLLAHLGILLLLFGSWITERVGIDGSLRVTEGDTASVVEMDAMSFAVIDSSRVHSVPVKWIPPSVAFKPISLSDYGLPYDIELDRFLSRADAEFSFVPTKEPDPARGPMPAVKLRLKGGPMAISQTFWLWAGEPGWSKIQAGPAVLALMNSEAYRAGGREKASGQPTFQVGYDKKGALSYRAVSSKGKVLQGHLTSGKILGQVVDTGWMGMTITFEEWIPDASPFTTYKPARVEYGPQAPTSAIHVKAGSGPGGQTDIWLGLGDRATLHLGDRDVDIGFFPQRVVLPFSIRLDRFTVDRYEGSMDPSSYSSRVTVLDSSIPGGQQEALISMNEPLQFRGFTLYQASYEDAQPRPVTSIFSVNRDPGRPWKYAGSLLLVFGTILLFAVKYMRSDKKKNAAKRTQHQQQEVFEV